VKSSDTIEELKSRIRKQAEGQYSINVIVERYMECIEEIINVPSLLERFEEATKQGHLPNILREIIKQSKVEFNYEDDYDTTVYEEVDIIEE